VAIIHLRLPNVTVSGAYYLSCAVEDAGRLVVVKYVIQ